MKRVVDVLYGLKGYPNAARFAEFKTDFFANGATPPLSIDTAGTYGLNISAAMSGAAINMVGNTPAVLNVTSGTITSVINILAAATITNLIKFNAAAGCVGAADVACDEEPSAGGLGADGHIVIAIGATPYYIPIFNSLTA